MAKQKEEKILNQTRSTFKAVGLITGVDRDNFYESRILEKGKASGREMRFLRFGLKTSNQQQLRLQMTGIEPEQVFLFDTQNRKDGKATQVKMDYDEYVDRKEELDEDGVISYESRLQLEEAGKDGKVTHGIRFDNIEIASELLENGMAVYLNGTIERSTYTGQDGNDKQAVNYNVNQITLLDRELDFDAPDFKEYAMFTEEFVLTDTFTDRENEKLVLNGKVIDYKQGTQNVAFDVSWAEEFNHVLTNHADLDGEDAEKEAKETQEQIEMKKGMIKAFKKVKFGSLLKIDGQLINRAVVTEEEEEADSSDLMSLMRGNSTKRVTNYINLLNVTGTQSYEPEKYTEDDFIKALDETELVKEDKKEEDDNLGALKGNKTKAPDFLDEEDDEDDLPF